MNSPGSSAFGGLSIVAREAELDAIEAALASALVGKSVALLVLGEPGIGKTTLLQAAAGMAEGMSVVNARGIEAESELGWAGLGDVLRSLLGHLDALVPHQRAVLEGVLALRPPTPADPLGTSAAALALLAAAADERPLLVVVDDFHWLDSPSQLALVYIARRLQAEPIAVLIGARTLPSRLAQPGLPELRLPALDRADAAALLASRAPTAASEVVDAILDTAGGNPLALVEMTSFLDESELTGRVPLPRPLPVNGPVEASFMHLVEELDDGARRVLLVAAADDTSDPGVVRRAVETLGVPSSALDEAVESGAIALGPPVRFRHPILRSLVYLVAAERDRRSAHAALASVIDVTDAYRRAWHNGRATIEPDEEVAAALADAAGDARARQQFSSAAAAGSEAARLTPNSDVRAQRLVLSASDCQLSGNFDAAEARISEALGITSDVAVRAEAQQIRGQGLIAAARQAEAFGLLMREGEEFADLVPDAAALMLAHAALASQPLGRIDEGLVAGRRAVEVAEKAGPAAQFAASLAYAEVLALRGDSQAIAELQARARSVAPLEDPIVAGMLLQSEAGFLMIRGEHVEARLRVEQLVAGARAAGALGVLTFPLALLAEIAFRGGRWREAIAAGSEAVEISEQTGQLGYGAFALQILARIEAALGHEALAESHADRAESIGEATRTDALRFYVPAARAFLALTIGDLASAVDHGRDVEEISRDRGLREPAVVLWPPDLIEAYARLGRVREATRVLERFAEEAAATSRVWALAAGARCRGLLDDDFEAAFAEALGWHERIEMPFERARTELCLGERRRRAGRRADARSPLRSALRTFERLGSTPWSERARSELRATGERVRRRGPAVTDQLTPHELRVALVVARGATNREAAAELFVSPKTVDFHLRHVYRKLGISSRVELVRVLAERPA